MAASNYAACLAKVLRYEGGYVNDPHDPGGETNYGITVAVARANGYTGPMRSIPMDLVRKIYRVRYWDVVKADDLPAGLDLCVFDYAVNSGPGRALPLARSTRDIKAYCDARLKFLHGLKTWSRYGKGWSSRVADVQATALKMAANPATPADKATTDTTKIGGGAVAGGAVIAAGASTAAQSGWGATEWALLFVGLIVLIAAAAYGWHVWKAKQAKADAIRDAGTQAGAGELKEPTASEARESRNEALLAMAGRARARGAVHAAKVIEEMVSPPPPERRTKRKPKKPAKRSVKRANKRRA